MMAFSASVAAGALGRVPQRLPGPDPAAPRVQLELQAVALDVGDGEDDAGRRWSSGRSTDPSLEPTSIRRRNRRVEVAQEPLLVGRGHPQRGRGQEAAQALVHRRGERGQAETGRCRRAHRLGRPTRRCRGPACRSGATMARGTSPSSTAHPGPELESAVAPGGVEGDERQDRPGGRPAPPGARDCSRGNWRSRASRSRSQRRRLLMAWSQTASADEP